LHFVVHPVNLRLRSAAGERGFVLDFFEYRNAELHADGVPVSSIINEVDTPCYIYSLATIKHHYQQLVEAFEGLDTLICFSIKANWNLSILSELISMGAGFDVVSGGELYRALEAGAEAGKIVYAGVGKTRSEIDYALSAGILMFNVESEGELEAIRDAAASRNMKARVALRINPDVDPHTHERITTGKAETKFGLDPQTALELAGSTVGSASLEVIGVHSHIGSQITHVEPYGQTLERLADMIGQMRQMGVPVRYLNAGGGFGIDYGHAKAPLASRYAEVFRPILNRVGCSLIIEPGRFIVGNAGILATRILYVKKTPAKHFYIVDAAMNDLIRPSLYDAYHRIWPVLCALPDQIRVSCEEGEIPHGCRRVDVVGPVCESGDYFARHRVLPELKQGDLLSIFSAGAYGMVMASNYNSRPRPPEVLAFNGAYRLIRRRETYEDLVKPERVRY